jgi:uncharacterized protein (TIGR02246 family)
MTRSDGSDARAFIETFSRTVDSRDGSAVAACFEPDGAFVFANHPPAIGHETIAAATGAFFEMIAGIHHDVREAWDVGDDTVCARLTITYERSDGKTVALPCANIVKRGSSGRIARFEAYIDTAPLFAP